MLKIGIGVHDQIFPWEAQIYPEHSGSARPEANTKSILDKVLKVEDWQVYSLCFGCMCLQMFVRANVSAQ